jgi:hypothetical protein
MFSFRSAGLAQRFLALVIQPCRPEPALAAPALAPH